MKKKYQLIIGQADIDKRLDVAIADHIEISRSNLKKYCISLTVNQKNEKFSYKCKLDDLIRIELEYAELELIAESIPLEIVYEDENYIVVNKKWGMVVHPAAGNTHGTLVNALLGMKKELSKKKLAMNQAGTGENFRPGIVHRLDKDTSGLIMIVKNNRAHYYLADLFKKRLIKKRYKAIVKGFYTPSQHTIISNIGRDPKNRKKMAVLKGSKGRESITSVKVIRHFEHYSFLKILLKTGRTHQIRVHLSEHGFPIVGDPIYARADKNFKDVPLCLAADLISFTDPLTQKSMKFEIQLPLHMQKVLNQFS